MSAVVAHSVEIVVYLVVLVAQFVAVEEVALVLSPAVVELAVVAVEVVVVV